MYNPPEYEIWLEKVKEYGRENLKINFPPSEHDFWKSLKNYYRNNYRPDEALTETLRDYQYID